ncbi:MAG: FAD-dependent oxidoreductase [Halobacteriovoraceae bacterium]|jgi:L-2-hydroxyglutarate oxidase LhgO|nr:FAD-dependent oxidoreductase [Halobacteriovoraceae bacterium]MBT5094488.1 FAD-dependent oxidoreductase [Halobacteriovoraceae bacterium]
MHIDGIIIGGGIVGLALAEQLMERFPNFEFALFEENPYPGECSSSRNSGVLHSGIYYKKNSLKHLHCLRGRELWDSLANKYKIPIKKCGKILFANGPEEIAKLEALKENGVNNQVPELSWADEQLITEVSDYVNVDRALVCGSTGIIDLAGAIRAISQAVYNKNIPILLDNKVKGLSKSLGKFEIQTTNENFTSNFVFNCAGRNSLEIRNLLGLTDLSEKLVKGHYLKYSGNYYREKLLYPMPLKSLKGLGIHTCLDFEGNVLFGPDAQERTDASFRMEEKDIREMKEYVLQTYKGIDPDKLAMDYCGIRNKIIKAEKLFEDFWVGDPSSTGIKGYFEFCGIESPGFTSAPSLAEELCIKLDAYL